MGIVNQLWFAVPASQENDYSDRIELSETSFSLRWCTMSDFEGNEFFSSGLDLDPAMLARLENDAWLRLAQSAFDFWDNEDDAIYDDL